MVTPYLPYPPYSGGQTRSYHLLKHLSRKCEVTLFSFVLPDQNTKYVKHLERYCRKVVTLKRGKTWSLKKILFTGFSFYPFLVANYHSPEMRRLIAKEIRENDYHLLHIECFYLMPNIPRVTIPIILVDQTIEFAVYQHFVEELPKKLSFLKPLLLVDVFKIKFWETRFWKKADRLIAVSKEDRLLMKKLSGREVETVLNGVDEALLRKKKEKKYSVPTVLYGVANFKWIQNKEGAKNLLKFVWPEIKKMFPKARLFIAGRHSASFVNSVKLKERRDILVKEVDNPETVYRRSWVLVAPMKSGGGSRTKFFEAMACGLPIVTTPEGIEGIEAKEGQDVVIGSDFKEIAEKTVELLKNHSLRERIGQNGRRLVAREYSWSKSAETLLKIYRQIAQNE